MVAEAAGPSTCSVFILHVVIVDSVAVVLFDSLSRRIESPVWIHPSDLLRELTNLKASWMLLFRRKLLLRLADRRLRPQPGLVLVQQRIPLDVVLRL